MMVALFKGENELVGGLNINTLVRSDNGTKVLIRQPYENPRLFKELQEEYEATGFYDLGCRFKRRSPEEQATFSDHAIHSGLLVLAPVAAFGEGIFAYPFLEDAKSLDNVLPGNLKHASTIIRALFGDLYHAHQQDIVYGDRWLPNTLWTPDSRLTHIDFDLQISGPRVMDFEVAQLAYYTAVAAPFSAVAMLADELSKPGWFHPNSFFQVLRKHARYFLDSVYGDQRGVIEELVDLVSAHLAIRSES